ncbi:flavin reductase family protein [Catenulispora yoronensis]
MATLPTGVAIVTVTGADGRPYGMTCSTVSSVAVAPPTLLVCLRSASPTCQAVLARGGFTVNLLHRGAQSAAELFASGAPDRFDRIGWDTAPDGAGPQLTEHAHAVLDCDLARSLEVADHHVVIGTVRASRRLGSEPPLLYGFRRYSAWQDPGHRAG